MIYLRRMLSLPRSLFVRLLLTDLRRRVVELARRVYGQDFATQSGPAAHAFRCCA